MAFKIYNGRNNFYQWDTNQKIIVPNLNCEIHFKQKESRECLICKPYTFNGKILVDVPNILLQNAGTLTLWVYVNGEYTKEQGVFEISPRQKPASYAYSEVELTTYRALEKRIEALEASLTVNSIVIVNQPVDVVAAAGEIIEFTVVAQGDGLAYQWYFKKENGEWALSGLTGNNTPTIRLDALASRNGYQYRCLITDAYGNTLTSEAASLTVT